jgi:hypothetical protein
MAARAYLLRRSAVNRAERPSCWGRLLSSTEGTPIAQFRVPRARQVPRHDLSLLAGCSTEDQIAIGERIGAAIESGAPVYNKGSLEGCFHIYAAVVYEVDADFPGCHA